MTAFEKLTKRNAQAFFEAYLDRKDAVLAEFIKKIETQGGSSQAELDFSPQSLVPLWTWLWPRLRLADEHPENQGQLPMWYAVEVSNNPHGNTPLPVETALWIDGLAYYFGDTVVKNIPDAKWAICTDNKAAYYNKPVIDGSVFIYPLNNMIVVTMQAVNKHRLHSDKALLEVFKILQNYYEKYKSRSST